MKKRNSSEDYVDFFLKLPQVELPTDYIKDIEIQDVYESPDDSGGLSEEQVSQLASDSLEDEHNLQNKATGDDHTASSE